MLGLEFRQSPWLGRLFGANNLTSFGPTTECNETAASHQPEIRIAAAGPAKPRNGTRTKVATSSSRPPGNPIIITSGPQVADMPFRWRAGASDAKARVSGGPGPGYWNCSRLLALPKRAWWRPMLGSCASVVAACSTVGILYFLAVGTIT
jgi:hypothetical protein